MQIKYKKLHPDVPDLKRATDGSAGYDLYAMNIDPIGRVNTGVSIEIPLGYVGLIRNRSSIGNLFFEGTIDADYRGEILLKILKHNEQFKLYHKVAQLVIVPCFMDEMIEVDELSETQRGSGAFGSTGR